MASALRNCKQKELNSKSTDGNIGHEMFEQRNFSELLKNELRGPET